eukprot:CAMPEP_0201543842 /NCGR_PEP_ID=MMETSP0161_2-20130828/72833_1 /ASSEMBLY_ACC=CAM_ASM_000251 /TAXON_ID=180227 /ORGANISM="Neoparamoeba aestuarina, Strain SoJaBio B1-5/56/2" /LENGTH=434 /DNA_ID=CAMNT_0047951689 /DNA_START=414 /DNA_END=1718 /DNA_ORIENTATION=+
MKKHYPYPDIGWEVFSGFDSAMERQQIPDRWRVSCVNAAYTFSATYPNKLIVPADVEDEDLLDVFQYRSKGRMPVLSYFHLNGATITRCAQPMAGISRTTCTHDEELLVSIRDANPLSDTLYIYDARPRLNALGNQAAGAGFEATGVGTGYVHCKLDFLNIDNIHVIRKSHNALQTLVEEKFYDKEWLLLLHNTQWLYHIRQVLAGAVRVARTIESGTSALLHCSDGWDRTAQLAALAQFMIRPMYRTIQGFEIIVEKEWLAFGHRFEQRHGHGKGNYDDTQRAPIFAQFIDCVWQLMRQYPCAFEFNETFLIKVIDSSYSCLYGTFLFNCEIERKENELRRRTVSLWSDINREKEKYVNPFYTKENYSIYPSLDCDSLKFWRNYYLRAREEEGGGRTEATTHIQLQNEYEKLKKELERLKKEHGIKEEEEESY